MNTCYKMKQNVKFGGLLLNFWIKDDDSSILLRINNVSFA